MLPKYIMFFMLCVKNIMNLNNPPLEFDYDFLDAMFQEPTDPANLIFAFNHYQPNRMCLLRLLLEETRINNVPGASIDDELVVVGDVYWIAFS